MKIVIPGQFSRRAKSFKADDTRRHFFALCMDGLQRLGIPFTIDDTRLIISDKNPKKKGFRKVFLNNSTVRRGKQSSILGMTTPELYNRGLITNKNYWVKFD